MAIFDFVNGIAGWGTAEELFGKKPNVPEFPTSSEIGAEMAKANQANLPAYARLAESTNEANRKAYQDALRKAIPGYDELVASVSGSTLSAAKGELPSDVVNMLKRTTAEGALRGGYQGSQVANFSLAQNLGLTSLQVQDSFDRWLKRSQQLTSPGFMDVTSMFISPAQQIGISEGKFQRDMLKASVDAAPDPAKRGVLDLEMGILGEILSIYGGGAGYTQTYKQPQMGGGGGGEFETSDPYQADYLSGGSGGKQWGGLDNWFA